jgi:hypothetical protein
MEIMQAAEARYQRRQGGRYRWVLCIRKMLHAVDAVAMDLGAEGAAHFGGIAREGDPRAAARHAVHREALLLEPAHDLIHVALRSPEAIGVLFRRKPLVEVGRRGVLLVLQQLAYGVLLVGGGLEHQGHRREREGVLHLASIVLGAGLRMHTAGERNPAAVIDGAAQSVALRVTGGQREKGYRDNYSESLRNSDHGRHSEATLRDANTETTRRAKL